MDIIYSKFDLKQQPKYQFSFYMSQKQNDHKVWPHYMYHNISIFLYASIWLLKTEKINHKIE